MCLSLVACVMCYNVDGCIVVCWYYGVSVCYAMFVVPRVAADVVLILLSYSVGLYCCDVIVGAACCDARVLMFLKVLCGADAVLVRLLLFVCDCVVHSMFGVGLVALFCVSMCSEVYCVGARCSELICVDLYDCLVFADALSRFM